MATLCFAGSDIDHDGNQDLEDYDDDDDAGDIIG